MQVTIGRRELIATLGGLAAWPLAARAQQAGRIQRIGFLSSYTANAGKKLIGCFRNGLEQLGWFEGRTINIEYRWAEGRQDRYTALAAELTSLGLDVIACNSTPATQALQRATREIPIVFMTVSEPVDSGIVTSLTRPQGNITGVSNYSPATAGKMLELLKTVVPNISRVLVLRDPANLGKELDVRVLQVAGRMLGVMIQVIDVRNCEDIERTLLSVAQSDGVAVVTLEDGVTFSYRERLVELATRDRLPTIFQTREFVDAGGLMSYGVDFCQHFQRAATYVDKILKGAKPADLPVELPTTFELVLNLKTAKAIGVIIPDKLIAFAVKVIE